MKKDSIYKRMADVREDLDLTQKKLAEKMKVKSNVYSKWEREIELMPLTRLNQFCNVTEVSMDYVTGLTLKKEKTNNIEVLDKKEIGKKLRQIRKSKNMSQQDMADFLKTSQSVISAYENGKVLILSAFIYQIAVKYQISLDWICGRREEQTLKKSMSLT